MAGNLPDGVTQDMIDRGMEDEEEWELVEEYELPCRCYCETWVSSCGNERQEIYPCRHHGEPDSERDSERTEGWEA